MVGVISVLIAGFTVGIPTIMNRRTEKDRAEREARASASAAAREAASVESAHQEAQRRHVIQESSVIIEQVTVMKHGSPLAPAVADKMSDQ